MYIYMYIYVYMHIHLYWAVGREGGHVSGRTGRRTADGCRMGTRMVDGRQWTVGISGSMVDRPRTDRGRGTDSGRRSADGGWRADGGRRTVDGERQADGQRTDGRRTADGGRRTAGIADSRQRRADGGRTADSRRRRTAVRSECIPQNPTGK